MSFKFEREFGENFESNLKDPGLKNIKSDMKLCKPLETIAYSYIEKKILK